MQMRAIQENDMAEPGPQWASEGTAGLAEGAGESQKSPGQNPPTPGSRSGGVRCSPPAAEDLERRGDLSPRRGTGTARRSPARPWPPQRPPARRPNARPLQPAAAFAPSSLHQQGGKSRVPHPTDQRVAAPQAKFTQPASPPASSAPAPTLPSRGTLGPPRGQTYSSGCVSSVIFLFT